MLVLFYFFITMALMINKINTKIILNHDLCHFYLQNILNQYQINLNKIYLQNFLIFLFNL